jgi:hypothetical protein
MTKLSFRGVTKVTTNRVLKRCRQSRVFVAFRFRQPEQIDLIKMSTWKAEYDLKARAGS